MTEIKRLQSEGMTEMVARRHLDDRRKVIRLVESERREAMRRAVREWIKADVALCDDLQAAVRGDIEMGKAAGERIDRFLRAV